VDSNPCLTRQNTDLPAVSLRLVPIRSRSLPAEPDSVLDDVKSEKAGEPGRPERRVGLAETAIALRSFIMNDEEAPSRGCDWCSRCAGRNLRVAPDPLDSPRSFAHTAREVAYRRESFAR
jgi:hypothetical protein